LKSRQPGQVVPVAGEALQILERAPEATFARESGSF
jgi:hypothetical protein